MQPTLYGITSVAQAVPGWADRLPVKPLKWLVTGDWYTSVRAKTGGVMGQLHDDRWDPSVAVFQIGGRTYKVPIDAVRRGELRHFPGEYLSAGAEVWSGIRKTGDHVFVDKVSWNFRAPRRGEVMVFNTRGITALQQDTHYIKRLCGLPGETLGIHPPDLLIDGKAVRSPRGIERVAGGESTPAGEQYAGYQLVDPRSPEKGYLRTADDVFKLADDQYFAMGDNTMNSRDSRYWGAVPRKNLLGPGLVVYWPFSRRWGVIR